MVRNAGNNRRGAGGGGGRRRRQAGRPGGNAQSARTTMPQQITLKPAYTTPYKFSRSFDLGDMARPSATDQGFAFPFALNQLPGASDFTNLFDRYRINKIDLTFSWILGDVRVNGGILHPIIYVYMDDDDSAIPLTKQDVFERQAMQRYTFSEAKNTLTTTISPRWVQSRSGVSTNLAAKGTWIDMATPGVQHYGVKGWVDYMSSAAPNTIRVTGNMHFECAVVR
jgi:hypothetical protein